ncbi:MAG: PAS domain S-box protein [Planctomycetota bacterium]
MATCDTIQRHAHEARCEPDDRFRLMIDRSLDVIVIVDCGSGKVVETNRAMQRVLGYEKEDILGRPFSFLFSRSSDHKSDSWRRNLRVHGYVFEAQEFARADGSICHMDLTATMIPWNGGVAALITLRDVTERLQAEEKRRESEEKYRTLFHDSPEAISITQKGKLTDVNPVWLQLHGFERREEVLGRSIMDFIHPDDRCILTRRRETPPDQLERGYEIRDLRKDGTAVHVEVYSSRIQIHGEDAILTTVRDISERKTLQKELIQSAKMAAVGTMISGIAHELNNPLAAISGYAHLLSESDDLPEQARQDVGRITVQTARCAAIVENLLRFARREKAEKAATDLNEVLQNTVDLRRYEMRVNDVEVIEEYEPHLESVHVNAHQLQQVFLNIISNAFDAIKERKGRGKIIVRTHRNASAVVVQIEDDGGGIQHLDRIFEPFFTTKDVGKGTGLGLSVAYGIVKEHGGAIQAENTAEGAIFTIRLPMGGSAVKGKSQTDSETKDLPTAGKKILVVDDEEDVCEAVRRILSPAYTVHTAATIPDAIRKLESEKYDIVISDLRIPGPATVQEFYAWMQEHTPGLADRTIFMTGSIVPDKAEDMLGGAVHPVVSKPFAIEQLRQVVNGVAAVG